MSAPGVKRDKASLTILIVCAEAHGSEGSSHTFFFVSLLFIFLTRKESMSFILLTGK